MVSYPYTGIEREEYIVVLLIALFLLFGILFLSFLYYLKKKQQRTKNQEKKELFKVDEIISDGVIANFPKKILVENINTSDNVSIITLSIENKINAINIRCTNCNATFPVKDHKTKMDVPMQYQYKCPNCKFKYFSNAFIDNSRNNEIVLIFDKKD